MSASDNGAKGPDPLCEGLLDGEAGNPVVTFQQLLEQAVAAMNGQNKHNGATTAALRNHQETLVSHSNLLDANKTSIEKLVTSVGANKDSIATQTITLQSHGTSITNNTDNITEHKKLINANKDGVKSLTVAKTKIEAEIKSHKDWQDRFANLQEMVTSKNEYEILGLQKHYASQQLQLLNCEEKLDKQTMALATIGELAGSQEEAIHINRSRTISNSNAINTLESHMVLEQEISDERFRSIDTMQGLRSSFDREMATSLNAIGTLFTKLATKSLELHTETKKAKYNAKEMEEWLPPALQKKYATRRRKRGKRKAQKVWEGVLSVPKVPVAGSYKKVRLANLENWKSVPTEAETAITRIATHADAKAHAETLLATANTALVAHEEKEERRRQEDREAPERLQEEERLQQEEEEREEMRLQEEDQQGVHEQRNVQKPQQPDLQDPPSNKDDNNSEETDEESYFSFSPQGAAPVVSPEN